jgi:hypothetical protein
MFPIACIASACNARVELAIPVNTVAPALSSDQDLNDPSEGVTLTTDDGSWTNSPTRSLMKLKTRDDTGRWSAWSRHSRTTSGTRFPGNPSPTISRARALCERSSARISRTIPQPNSPFRISISDLRIPFSSPSSSLGTHSSAKLQLRGVSRNQRASLGLPAGREAGASKSRCVPKLELGNEGEFAFRTPNSELRTPNSDLRSPISDLLTPNSHPLKN